jgi:CheY-like chemotaxis protein
MPKTILVVDDELIVVQIAKRKLEERGYEVMIAGDGEAALEKLKIKVPDLILLDVQMPKMNGYSFLMEKNKFPEFENIPIIVLTAYNEMEPIFRRHRIKAYLLKPLKLQDLLNKVEELLNPPPAK